MFAKPTNDLNDDLSDLLGLPSEGPRPLPQDEAAVRIRESAPSFDEVCSKCRGSGQTRWGQCFKCKGRGKRTFKRSPEKRAAAKAGRLARKASREDVNLDAFKAAHPGHWDWIARTAATPITDRNQSFVSMVQEIPGKIARWGDLHPGTMAMIERGIARDAEHAVKAASRAQEAVARSVEVDTARIEQAFQRRRDAGKIRIALHYDGLYISPMRSNPAALRVKASKGYEAAYYGKIEAGRFYPTRDCPEEIKGRLATIAADPAAAARVDGKETGICCCCGAQLTDPVSIAAGIGPICAGGWGF
jgi:hypothetical protein